MSTPTVDYDALAKQYGATSSQPAQSAAVDYDALAKQYGATSSQAPQSAPQVSPQQQAYRKATASGPFAPAGAAEQAIGANAGLKDSGRAVALGAAYGIPALATGGGSLLGEMALGGGSAAAQAKLEGGSNKATAAAGALGAAGPVVAKGISKLAEPLSEWAQSQYSKVLAPTTAENKAITQKVVPQLLNRGVTATSRSALQETAQEGMTQAGEELDKAWAAIPPGRKLQMKPVLDSLENSKQQFMVNGVAVNPLAVAHIEDLEGTLKQFGADVTPDTLRKVRQILDTQVAASKGFFGKTVAEGSQLDATREAANAIRGELANAHPNIAKINAEYSLWANVDKVLDATQQRIAGQRGPLIPKLASMAAAAGGFAHGGLMQGAEVGTGLYLLGKAMETPAWRTVSAVTKNQIAQAIATGQTEQLTRMLTPIVASKVGQAAYQTPAQQ